MIVPEKYNVEKLSQVLKCDNLPIRPKKGENLEMEIQKQKILLKRFSKLKNKDGFLEIEYNQKNCMGRMYPKNYVGLSPMKKTIHHYIAGEYYTDLDIVNCHPVLIIQLMEKNGIKCDSLNEYIINRDNYLEKYNLDKDSFFNKIYNLESPPSEAHSEIFDKCIELVKILLKDERNKNIMKQIKFNNKKEKFKNYGGKFLALIIQDIENDILMEMYDFFIKKGYPIYSLMFDGLGIDKNFEINNDIIIKCCEHIKTKTGYTVNLKIKPTETDWVPTVSETDLVRVEKFSISQCEEIYTSCLKQNEDGDLVCDSKLIKEFYIPYISKFLCRFIDDMTYGWREDTSKPFRVIKACPDIMSFTRTWGSWLYSDYKLQYDKPVFIVDENSEYLKPSYYNSYIRPSYNENYKTPHMYLDFIRDVVCDGNIELYNYMIKWMAYIWKRGMAFQAIFLMGEMGLGKSVFAKSVGKVMGDEYCTTINTIDKITNRFNAKFENKIVTIVEEVTADAGNINSFNNMLKDLTTNVCQSFEKKGVDDRDGYSNNNFIFLTNEYNPVKIKKDNRRNVIIDFGTSRMRDDIYYKELTEYISNNIEDIRGFINDVEFPERLESIRPTTLKELELLEIGMAIEDRFISDALVLLGSDIHRSRIYSDVYKKYCRFCERNGEKSKSSKMFSKKLRDNGFSTKRIGNKNTTIILGEVNMGLWEDDESDEDSGFY